MGGGGAGKWDESGALDEHTDVDCGGGSNNTGNAGSTPASPQHDAMVAMTSPGGAGGTLDRKSISEEAAAIRQALATKNNFPTSDSESEGGTHNEDDRSSNSSGSTGGSMSNKDTIQFFGYGGSEPEVVVTPPVSDEVMKNQ